MTVLKANVAPGLQLRACGVTDVGKERSDNEDAFLLGVNGCFWVVADGMGGQAAGEIASSLAVNTIRDSIECEADQTNPEVALLRAFASAHAALGNYVATHRECAGMGSAAAAACIDADILHVCHSGDVRCYIRRRDSLERVTTDHSMVESLVLAGIIPREAAICHEDRSRLEQAIGVAGDFSPSLNRRKLDDGDRVLLCSDGLWEPVGDDGIAEVLASDGSMRQLATVLADRALAAGGPDNITAVVYEHRGSNPRLR